MYEEFLFDKAMYSYKRLREGMDVLEENFHEEHNTIHCDGWLFDGGLQMSIKMADDFYIYKDAKKVDDLLHMDNMFKAMFNKATEVDSFYVDEIGIRIQCGSGESWYEPKMFGTIIKALKHIGATKLYIESDNDGVPLMFVTEHGRALLVPIEPIIETGDGVELKLDEYRNTFCVKEIQHLMESYEGDELVKELIYLEW